jgi:DnaJ-class molecular chaperone
MDCSECGGSGVVDCDACEGTGEVEDDDEDEDNAG